MSNEAIIVVAYSAALFVAGLVIGHWCLRWIRILRGFIRRRQIGICESYSPHGYRETRNGTNSDFCRRCGHPAGLSQGVQQLTATGGERMAYQRKEAIAGAPVVSCPTCHGRRYGIVQTADGWLRVRCWACGQDGLPSYWRQGCQNLSDAHAQSGDLLAGL